MGLNAGRLGAGGRRLLLISSEENKQIALSLLQAINARDLRLWSRHLAEDYIAEHPGVSIPLDNTRSMGYNQRFVTALPDIHLEVLHVLAEGDHVLIHWRASGTHTERLATLTGETIPPTRRRVRVSGALLTEVRDGKIVHEWTYWDQLSLLAQLGITEQPGLFLSPEGF
jgi:predicted ester cyclase